MVIFPWRKKKKKKEQQEGSIKRYQYKEVNSTNSKAITTIGTIRNVLFDG